MTTTLGDARIKIILDPGSIKQEQQALSSKIEEIQKLRQEEERELDRLKDQAGDAVDASKGAKGDGDSEERRKSLLDSIKSSVGNLLTPLRTAARLTETAVSKAGQGIESATKGTFMEQFGKAVNEKVQALADEVTAIRTRIEAVGSTAQRVVQFNLASLRLGGKFPPDEEGLIKQVYKVESTLKDFQANVDRDVSNNTIDSIFRGVKAAAGFR